MSLDTIDPIPEQITFIEENSTEIWKTTTQTRNESSSISFEHIAPACPVCCLERASRREENYCFATRINFQ